jgi:hypothetical protein
VAAPANTENAAVAAEKLANLGVAENFLFMGGVAFNRIYKVRNKIAAPLELVVDFRHALIYGFIEFYQGIARADVPDSDTARNDKPYKNKAKNTRNNKNFHFMLLCFKIFRFRRFCPRRNDTRRRRMTMMMI